MGDAEDQLTKPFQAPQQRARLRADQRILDLKEQLLETREAPGQPAPLESLTGLLNQRAILGLRKTEPERVIRESQPSAVLPADLRSIQASRDREQIAGDAVVARGTHHPGEPPRAATIPLAAYGDEEFLIGMPGSNGKGVLVAQIERLRARPSEPSFFDNGDRSVASLAPE